MLDRIAAIRRCLSEELAPEHIDIVDESHKHIGHVGAQSGGGHFKVTIVSEKFNGQSSIQRHRMVYAAVAELMPAEIHALSIQALTPEE